MIILIFDQVNCEAFNTLSVHLSLFLSIGGLRMCDFKDRNLN